MSKTPSGSNSSSSRRRSNCRVCLASDLVPVLTLGATPPANAFLAAGELTSDEPSFPLDLNCCRTCGFVQLADVVSPELLFNDYLYVSSTSPAFVKHFEELGQEITSQFRVPAGSLAIDIGSNDGILLKPLKQLGWNVLGVDPAHAIAARATDDGIETLPRFFSPELAQEIRTTYGPAHLITATSAFPHIDDLDAVITGVKTLLAPGGVFLVEAYYLGDLIKQNLFDTIYHEHLSYFTVSTVSRLFQRLGMELFDVERTDTHGGSLRLYVQKAGGPHQINRAAITRFTSEEGNK